MKTRLYKVIGSLLVLGGAFVIAWYLVMSPASDKVVETTATAAAASQDESIRLPEAEPEPAGLADNDPSTAGDEVGGIATDVPDLAAEETRAKNTQTGQPQRAPTISPATGLQPTEPRVAQAEAGTAQRPGAQVTVETNSTEAQPTEPQPTTAPAVEVKATVFQPADDPPSATEPTESTPVVIRQGQFRDGDEVHKGSGTATISQKPDGSYLLTFENFSVCCGPDLHVFLASNPSPAGHADLGDYLELSPLQASSGDQTYEISGTADLAEINSVVIYCKPFQVIISTATLEQKS